MYIMAKFTVNYIWKGKNMNNNSIFEAFKHIDDTLINIDGIPNKKEIQ